MISNSEKHLKDRNSRYFINSKHESFSTTLKGLTVIELCITELCTRACSFCPRGDSSVYKNQKLFMSKDTITNIGISCKEAGFLGDFHISGFGESTTHPQFHEIVSILRSILPDNRITLTTNGDLLPKSDNIRKLFDSGISYVIVSCYDGPEAAKEFTDRFEEAGIDEFEIRKLWYTDSETVEDMMNRNNFNNRSGVVTIQTGDNLNINNPCYLPFYKLVIDWNGNILICCNDWHRKLKGIGNVNKSSIQAIWNSSEFTDIREKLAKGDRKSITPCDNCNISGTLIGKDSVKALNL